MRQPWAVLLSVFGGAMAWVLGSSVPLAVATACVMFATAVVVGGAPRASAPLRSGTEQHGLIMLFDGHVRSLRGLQGKGLPDVVGRKADDALAAADAARPSVVRTAAAVDALDEAISAARKVSGRGEHATEAIGRSVDRLRSRRRGLVEKLTAAVDEVATVYAGLLELSATARTMGVGLDDGEVGAVNDSVTLLQMTFAELEADAADLANEGLV
ncbi:hypothetical protein [Mycolicibacterium stellerae]|uniref:hypothetical protein n=1 Tax=Mycolicibacterium stellerae TaxID=2358193 RepID=UPI0013DD9C2F|nr:hypothetical protein [Mycolicibacterium stellerae]